MDDKPDPPLLQAAPVVEAMYYSSPLISFGKFKEQCLNAIGAGDLNPYRKNSNDRNSNEEEEEDEKEINDMSKDLDVDYETVVDLMDVCDVSSLECDYDREFDYKKRKVYEEYPDSNPLQTIKVCKRGKTEMEELFYTPTLVQPQDEDHTTDSELIANDEVIMTCLVFHSEKVRKKMLEVLLLENVKLSEIRDMIRCRTDNAIFGDFSNNPDDVGGQLAKDLYPSSFFFIEKTFYNDTRNPLNRDYSKIIIEWAKESERYDVPGLGMLSSKSMEDVRVADLNVRLGYPYLFCHQGDCQHIVVFTDLRIRNENDPKLKKSYPFNIFDVSLRRKKCSICYIHLPKWVTVNDELAFEDPALFCDKCFRYLHYTEDGKKLTSFEAYPYTEQQE